VNKSFRWQAEPAGNNTASPSATLNLLFASGTSTPAETGLRIGSNGQITFASGQSFPGAGTILGVTAGSGLTGGGTNGNVTLNLDTTKIPQLNVANTFTGNQTVSGNLSATGAVTGSSFLIGSNLFAYGSLANSNAFLGFGGSGLNTGTQNTSAGAVALSSNTSGSQNTAVGASALSLNSTGAGNTALGVGALNASSTGSNNTASGNAALQSNTSGSYNTANGLDALFNNTTGSFNSALGFLAGPDSAHPNLTNSTAIGAQATVTANNSIVLGSISGVNGAGSNTNVGIGTTAPAFALDVHGTGNFTGPVTFAASQTFPNTISGVTAGAGLTGGGTTGNVTLNLDTTKVVTGVAAGTGLTGGGTGGALTLSLDTTKVPLLSAANTFTGNQLVAGNLNATGNLTANGSINGSSEVLTGTGSILLRVNQNSTSANSYGIIAQTTGPSAIGVYGQANDSNGIGVEGLNNSATGGFGVFGGVNNTSGVGVGVWGKTGSGTGSSIGVEADAFSPTGIGLYATNPAGGYAAKFAGAVQVMGDFSGTGNVSGTTVNATSAFSVGGTPFAFGSFSQLSAFLGFSGGVANTAQRDTANGVLALAVDTGGSNTASGTLALRNNTTGTSNTATGDEALSSNTIGAFNMADGFTAMLGNTSGSNNTAGGAKALLRNTIGGSNTAFGFAALFYNNDGVGNTAIGNLAGPDVTHGSLTNSTAIGANAEVTASNSLVLGSINGVNGATASTNVGIGTTAPTYLLHIGNQGTSSSFFRVEGPLNPSSGGMAASFGGYGDLGIDAPGIVSGRFVVKESGNVGVGLAAPTHIFQVGQGLGAAFADSWLTYSSRRWKTKIQTLPNALAKVEQLRGVSYDLKGSGKHEIGVIAEEVGQVVPEVVSFEENGKDAQGVDYSRLTALLIEAVKQQQRQIQGEQTTAREQQRELQQEQTQLAKALRQIKQQQRLLRAQASAMRSLKNEVRETRETLQKLNLKAPASQPGLLAAK
jgi:hypothetical protein